MVHTGSIWSYGPSTLVPTTEDAPKRPYGDYGIGKRSVEQYLMGQDRVRASVVHPGHISGPGWMPIGPAGNVDPAVIESLRAAGSCTLPDRGGETIHHVHAEDVAALHQACVEQPDDAAGESLQQRLHAGPDPPGLRRACSRATSATSPGSTSCRGPTSSTVSTPSRSR